MNALAEPITPSTDEMPAPLIFTDSAADKVRQLVEEEGNPDAMSLQYLMGAEIDYKEDLQGAQFVIKNPNATTTCGCGSSFTA